MRRLKDDPTKAEEIQHFNKFYNNLPFNSYLKMILKDAPQIIENLIKNDLGIELTDGRETASYYNQTIKLAEENRKLKANTDNNKYIMKKALRRFRQAYKKLINNIQSLEYNNKVLEDNRIYLLKLYNQEREQNERHSEIINKY